MGLQDVLTEHQNTVSPSLSHTCCLFHSTEITSVSVIGLGLGRVSKCGEPPLPSPRLLFCFVLFCFLVIRTSEPSVGGGEVRERTQGQTIKSSYSYLKRGDDSGSFIVFLFVFVLHFPLLPLATTPTSNDSNSYWLSCHP